MLGFILGVFVGGIVAFVIFAILGVAKMDDRDDMSCSNYKKKTHEVQSEMEVGCMFDE